MTMLETWVATPAAKALGWTLFYSLFEGALVALVLAAVLWVVRSSRVRYAAACLAMLAMCAGFGVTYGRVLAQQRIQQSEALRLLLLPPPPDDSAGAMRTARNALSLKEVLPWLAPFWIAGVLIFHLRSLAGWMAARRLCRTGVCHAPDPWRERLDQLRARLRLTRPVALLESGLAGVPVAIGYLRPMILMPAGLLTGLPAGQIETILLHELAHIRRCDYLVNLLQAFVEGLLFYHPAIWWISGVIRAEREHCCDDLVVATLGNAGEYAAALAALEANRTAVPTAAAAATGGSLTHRIRRLLAPAERPRAGATPVFAAVVLTLTAVVASTAWQTPQVITPKGPYSKWLNEDVAYIITDVERRAFLNLQTDDERRQFIAQFWDRRNPHPGSANNAFQEEHYRRIGYANEHFDSATTAGWKTDRGRIYIVYGPPDEIESHPVGGPDGRGGTYAYPFEQWLYHHIEGAGDNVIIDFVDPTASGEYRMTSDPHGPAGQGIVAPPRQPEPPVPPTTANRAGAAVQPLGNGMVQISIPLKDYGDHPTWVYGRLTTRSQRVVGVFEDRPVAANGPVYSKATKLAPGSYKWFVAVRDLTTGTLYTDDLPFEVK